MKFREKTLASGAHLILGKNEESNDKLMREFQGKDNVIIHTVSPGSPFCVIDSPLNPSPKQIYASGVICARYSQDWRDNKSDAKVNVFTGKDVSKPKDANPGTWKVKNAETITVKRGDIIKVI